MDRLSLAGKSGPTKDQFCQGELLTATRSPDQITFSQDQPHYITYGAIRYGRLISDGS